VAITDRREAIKMAISLAKRDDIVLVAGKGHEKYQEINGVKNHFDDKEVVKEMFELFGK
jgi:UDP-N-acetylmuramoyl-L-alanyl-D-glutamate--2,6-diaminopimelate ligase